MIHLPLLQLQYIWFGLVLLLFSGYSLLDGFDLGVGALHLLARGDAERRLMIATIGPVWDGNEVWLVTAGGGLLAAFPYAYATLLSGFYLIVFTLLWSLILRAVAIEFRDKKPMAWWKRMWDVAFSFSSVSTSFLLGICLGNLMHGLPLNARGEFTGTFGDLITLHTVMMGITTAALFTLHGAVYLLVKTEGAFRDKAKRWVRACVVIYLVAFALSLGLNFFSAHAMIVKISRHPVLFLLPLVSIAGALNIVREMRYNHDGHAFFSSCLTMISMLALFGLGVYPHLVISNPVMEYSLTIFNASASATSLRIMLTIALIGMPFAVGYTTSVHYIFRHRVRLGESHYD